MPEKPTTAAGYAPDQVARVKSTRLSLATKLGDLMDELVVVGGLVPPLLVAQEHPPENVTPHVGTLDLERDDRSSATGGRPNRVTRKDRSTEQ